MFNIPTTLSVEFHWFLPPLPPQKKNQWVWAIILGISDDYSQRYGKLMIVLMQSEDCIHNKQVTNTIMTSKAELSE